MTVLVADSRKTRLLFLFIAIQTQYSNSMFKSFSSLPFSLFCSLFHRQLLFGLFLGILWSVRSAHMTSAHIEEELNHEELGREMSNKRQRLSFAENDLMTSKIVPYAIPLMKAQLDALRPLVHQQTSTTKLPHSSVAVVYMAEQHRMP